MQMPKETGLILFTHNDVEPGKPMNRISQIINFLQTGKLKNKNHNPTHTAVTIVMKGELYAVDSDVSFKELRASIMPIPFEKWKKGRAWIQVFDPNILTEVDSEDLFIKRVLDKTGQRYGFEDLGAMIKFLAGGKFKGQTDLNLADDSMICSVTTAYFYNYKDWPKRSPLNLFKERFNDAPFGVDIAAGKPEDITI